MSAVKDILKGAGRKVKGKAKDIFPSADSPNMNGMFQRLSGKGLEHPDTLTHAAVPWHIANKYTVPLAAGFVATGAIGGGFSMANQSKLGQVLPGEGLSGMSDGGIAGASATVTTPGLKALNDGSTNEARIESARVRNNMQGNISTSGAEGDIVFALHNMR